MKMAVIYKSNYGTTKQYAAWIADELDADLLERSTVKPGRLRDYDVIVYGGGLYASGILGIDLVTQIDCKRLVIFTVGLADPETTDYSAILDKNLPANLRNSVKVFHLRGGIDYKKIGLAHRGMMAMMKKMTIGKKTHKQLTCEEQVFADTYGKKVDFTNRESIFLLVGYVKSLSEING